MDFIHNLLWFHDKFLGITWNTWKVIGLVGNGIFFSRFIVQWYATEKRKHPEFVPVLKKNGIPLVAAPAAAPAAAPKK